ncbi:MAG: S-methyl-5'-thioadenosine phosphorylase, partial [Pseudomonadota bacterium]|nr:S-methyl-5'-thioadenosine phosphorylase [Pseudomonadota bacterium]
HDDVTVETIIKVLMDNADKARALVRKVVPMLAGRSETCHAGCHTALENALITAPDARDPALVEKLSAIAGRVLGV